MGNYQRVPGESRRHAPKKRYLDQSWKEELRKAEELAKAKKAQECPSKN